MKKTINQHEFCNEMMTYGFTYDGCVALYNHYRQEENIMGYYIEFNPIQISSEFTEYSSVEEHNKDYDCDLKTIEEIEEHCLVIKHPSGFLCAN